MGLDVRIPIGLMFAVIGLLLVIFGVATGSNTAMYERSISININLWWGAAMLAFGAGMLLLARLGKAAQGAHPTAESPEGRATEEREHRLGLEEERDRRPRH